MEGCKYLLDEALKSKDYTVIKWICDIRPASGSGNERLLRNIKPTKVQVKVLPEYFWKLTQSKTGKLSDYDMWSRVWFSTNPIDDKDNVLKKEIKFFANTAYDPGYKYFDTRKECVDYYNKLVFDLIQGVEQKKKIEMEQFDNKIANLREMFVDTDYTMEKLSRN